MVDPTRKCPHCSEICLRKNWMAHIQLAHFSQLQICEFCGLPFATIQACNNHIRSMHRYLQLLVRVTHHQIFKKNPKNTIFEVFSISTNINSIPALKTSVTNVMRCSRQESTQSSTNTNLTPLVSFVGQNSAIQIHF